MLLHESYLFPLHYSVIFHCISVSLFDNPFPADRYLNCFQFGALMNKVAMNIFVWGFFGQMFFMTHEKIPKSGIPRS